MSDDKTIRGPHGASRISLEEDHKVDCWTGKFGVCRDKLPEAVKAVGNSAAAVERHLTD